MKIQTVKFGEVEIEESRIFDFVLPIIGFNNLTKYTILEPDKDTLFKWLQSIEEPALAFPIISVAALDYDYTVDLADNVVNDLEITNPESLLVMNITSIPQDNPRGTTINLLAPLIFNLENRKAGQVVLSGSGYDISYPMFKKD
jgi:flagellar assembly factor FliW